MLHRLKPPLEGRWHGVAMTERCWGSGDSRKISAERTRQRVDPYAQNSGNSNSLATFTVSKISTRITAGRTILLPFLMARPAPR